MKYALSILLFTIISTASFAQPRGKGSMATKEQLERIHAIKVSYLTDRLHLTSKQAEQFWPIYNEYDKELQQVRQKHFKKNKDADREKVTSDQYDNDLDFQQSVLDIKRKYKENFLSVISSEQLVKLHASEKEFNKLLMQRIKKRREKMRD